MNWQAKIFLKSRVCSGCCSSVMFSYLQSSKSFIAIFLGPMAYCMHQTYMVNVLNATQDTNSEQSTHRLDHQK